MSTHNSPPTSSPNPLKAVRADAPSTPPKSRNRKRMLASLSTPDPLHDVPFSPGLKRSSAGLLRSPEHLQTETLSPFSSNNLLKTPGNADYDSDGGDTARHTKLMKTPQYFSPGRRLFAEDHSPQKKELGEISLQLKNRLSLAFGSLQQREKLSLGISPVKLDFSNGPYDARKDSPTRISSAPSQPERVTAALNRANINLQTLEASPRIETGPRHSLSDLKPPVFAGEDQPVSIPSPDEESSAHNALMVALSRAKERRKSHNNDYRRPSFGGLVDQRRGLQHTPSVLGPTPPKLPPINVRSPPRSEGASEQEAVYSLMSLSSPQAKKHDLHTLQAAAQMQVDSQIASSRELSRASSVHVPAAPPVLGLARSYDDDETDVEDGSASDSD